MKEVFGNLIDMALAGEFDLIAHGCNTEHAMFSGIAKEIAERVPEMKEADDQCLHPVAGEFSDVFVYAKGGGEYLFGGVNLYTQVKRGKNFELRYLKEALLKMSKFLIMGSKFCERVTPEFYKARGAIKVGVPLIGCGVGGGNEAEVLQVLKEFEEVGQGRYEVTLVRFKKE
jgi:O-acetyl-ADP-ribose deacetylase (regulator of RNase III)